MRADLEIKGRTLTGASDLTLLAPLQEGLVPSLDAVSHQTRLLRLLRLLNGGRGASHEFAFVRPISDSVERVARIHSVRVAVFEQTRQVMLSVTFDGTWEGYIRVLWQKVGTLLDIIFWDTKGYVLSTGRFDDWAGWVRRVQVETGFFFNTHGLTVGDAHYGREHEQLSRDGSGAALAALAGARLATRSAEEIASAACAGAALPELLRQGLQSLALLYRLADLYLPGTVDGDVLQRAARDLLLEFRVVVESGRLPQAILDQMNRRFQRQLEWLGAANRVAEVRTPRATPALQVRPTLDKADVQSGMLAGYGDATHGCLVLIGFADAKAGAAFLKTLRVTDSSDAVGGLFREKDPPFAEPNHPGRGPFHNVAITFEGLRLLGVPEAELQTLPQEFREGMAQRASILGDFRTNHPRRWNLPSPNWGLPGTPPGPPVQPSAVHLVVQIRAGRHPGNVVDDPTHVGYALRRELDALIGPPGQPLHPGVRVLHVQPMRRQRNGADQPMEHFGFADGKGQPQFTGPAPSGYPNQVPLGELLLGHPNAADPAPEAIAPLLKNGSFMVVRKLRQNVAPLRRAVAATARAEGLAPGLVLAKMMGRWQGGASLAAYPQGLPPPNAPIDTDFNYDADPQGRGCPLHAHVRRVNPRPTRLGVNEPAGRRQPRIVRRGMSYGPRAERLPGDPAEDGSARPGDDAERGLVFIAYNASIAEQFEIVQSWISGGNSTHGMSTHNDPFLGVPEAGAARHYAFEVEGPGREPRVVAMALDRCPGPFDDPEPFVRLEWGMYLFVPSISALALLQQRASAAAAATPWSAERGRQRIAGLETVDDWKLALEDPGDSEKLRGADVWAALREGSGVTRCPYGVIAATRERVDEVLGDDTRFSVAGYHARMLKASFDIYLGRDAGPDYEHLSKDVNAAIGKLTKAQAFTLAQRAAAATLQALADSERAFAQQVHANRWELNFDAKEVFDVALQVLCQHWLGLPVKDGPLVPGSWDWKPIGKPVYPVHFTPPSRWFFQPHPGDKVADFGRRYAEALVGALEHFVQPFHPTSGNYPSAPDGRTPAPLARAILDAHKAESLGTVARTFAGVLMGFLPTLDGNLRTVLNEWLRLGTLWDLRAAWAGDAEPPDLAKAMRWLETPMRDAMRFRSSPEAIWRTATSAAAGTLLGDVKLAAGDVVVAGLASAMHEGLEKPAAPADVYPAFGGDRSQPNHPTHACPGYEAAIGALLGVLSAFVDLRDTLRPSPAPLAFILEGRM